MLLCSVHPVFKILTPDYVCYVLVVRVTIVVPTACGTTYIAIVFEQPQRLLCKLGKSKSGAKENDLSGLLP